MTRAELLDAAKEAVTGDRALNYGSPEDNFGRIAKMWSVVLGIEVTAGQVALCMIQVKVARLANSPAHADSIVDGAGYFACYAEVAK